MAYRVQYIGSVYEKTYVASSALEFDCVLVLKGGDQLKSKHYSAGYARLKPELDELGEYQDVLDHGHVSTAFVRDIFMGGVQKCINELRGTKPYMKLKEHGPSVRMDILHNPSGKLWFSVDLLPAFALKDGSLFIPRPLKNEEFPVEPQTVWEESFALREKEVLASIDRHDNGIRKWCLRMLKVIRNNDPELKPISSYIIKMLVLRENQIEYKWGPKDLGVRLIGLMLKLARYLERGNMPHFDDHHINVLQGMDSYQRERLAKYIKGLAQSKSRIYKILGDNERKGRHTEL